MADSEAVRLPEPARLVRVLRVAGPLFAGALSVGIERGGLVLCARGAGGCTESEIARSPVGDGPEIHVFELAEDGRRIVLRARRDSVGEVQASLLGVWRVPSPEAPAIGELEAPR